MFPSLPCSQYTGFEACRIQTSFLFLHGTVQTASLHVIQEAWVQQTAHFLSHYGEKSAQCYFLPWLSAWIATWEWEFKGTAEGMMISWFTVFHNNELSWRRRRRGHFYKFFFFYPAFWKKSFHCLAPSVPICACALIRGDCSTYWVTAGKSEVFSYSWLAQTESPFKEDKIPWN